MKVIINSRKNENKYIHEWKGHETQLLPSLPTWYSSITAQQEGSNALILNRKTTCTVMWLSHCHTVKLLLPCCPAVSTSYKSMTAMQIWVKSTSFSTPLAWQQCSKCACGKSERLPCLPSRALQVLHQRQMSCQPQGMPTNAIKRPLLVKKRKYQWPIKGHMSVKNLLKGDK